MQAQYELWEASKRRRRKIAPLVMAHGIQVREGSSVFTFYRTPLHLLGQVILNADALDESKLLFQKIDVLFLIR